MPANTKFGSCVRQRDDCGMFKMCSLKLLPYSLAKYDTIQTHPTEPMCITFKQDCHFKVKGLQTSLTTTTICNSTNKESGSLQKLCPLWTCSITNGHKGVVITSYIRALFISSFTNDHSFFAHSFLLRSRQVGGV